MQSRSRRVNHEWRRLDERRAYGISLTRRESGAYGVGQVVDGNVRLRTRREGIAPTCMASAASEVRREEGHHLRYSRRNKIGPGNQQLMRTGPKGSGHSAFGDSGAP